MRKKAVMLMVMMWSCVLLGRDDPLDLMLPDTIRIGCPSLSCSIKAGDSLGVPIYLWNDEYVGMVSLAFTYSGNELEVTSWSLEGSTIPNIARPWAISEFFPQENRCRFYWSDHTGFSNNIPSCPGSTGLLLGTVYFKAGSTDPEEVVDIDSISIPGSSRFCMAWQPIATFVPNYADCGAEDIVEDSPTDINGDGVPNLADVTFLVDFLFRGGPAPRPALIGDANCDGRFNIVDAVSLVRKILQ